MNRWPIRVLACLALCGCQTGAPTSDEDCPSNSLCGDPDPDALLSRGSWQLPLPGCPSTLQVVFHATRPDEAPETPPDPSDSTCEGPEAPLLRAAR